MPDKKGSDDRAYARGFAAGRAAATPDPPCAHGLTGGRGAAERCFECGASVTAASPDERLREALALVYVMLTGAEPMWAEMPLDERCARAANEAQQAFLAADREAPDPRLVWSVEEARFVPAPPVPDDKES